MKPLIVKNSISINVSALKVWDALVSPEQKKDMFGCETVSDWQPGTPLLWKGVYEGKEMVFVKGIVAEIRPPVLLKYTVINPNAAMEDVPENYLNVIYLLEEQDGQTILTVLQDGFETADDGEKKV